MNHYRIHTTHKATGEVIKSPFVFTKKEAESKCERLNKCFKNGNHIFKLSENHKKEERRKIYAKDISHSELLTVVKHLEFNGEVE